MSAEHDPGIDVYFAESTFSRFEPAPVDEILANIRRSFQGQRSPPRLSVDEKRSMFASLYGASAQKIVEMSARSTIAC